VGVFCTAIDLELFDHGVTQRTFGQHALDRFFQRAARVFGLHVAEVCAINTAGIARMAVVHLIQGFVARDTDFGGVDDDNEVAGIDVKHEWFVIDATDKVLGRIASEAALRLRGKHKAIYTPHVDTGDFIVVINASKIRVTGNKALDKVYYRHSGFPGGIYGTNFRDMQAKHPGRALEKAVKGMLPKGPLGYAMIKKLKVYGGAEHPHSAQQPKPLDI